MSRKKKADVPAVQAGIHEPSRKDRLRPTELIVLSAVMAVFTGLIVLMVTREFVLAGVALGLAFIVALVVLAMLSLNIKPNPEELSDIDEQDRKE